MSRVEDGRRYSDLLLELREDLISQGQDEWAQRLVDAERGGATGTEVVARTGAVLAELRKSPVVRSRDVRRRIKEARKLARRLWRI